MTLHCSLQKILGSIPDTLALTEPVPGVLMAMAKSAKKVPYFFLSICLFDGQTQERKAGLPDSGDKLCPLSKTISSGKPKFLKTWLKSNLAISMAVGKTFKGIKQQALENL